MTTRRRNANSGQPGTAVWRGSIQSIRQELNASDGRLIEILEEQENERAEEVQPLFDLAESLRMEELLSYINDTLLEGQGTIQTVLHWQEGLDFLDDEDSEEEWDDEEDEDDEDEDWDDDEELEEEEGTPYLFVELMFMLSWKEAGRLQITVEFQDDEDEGIEMRVNGLITAPPTARNLQNALVQAFREQMDEDYGNFEED